MRQEDIDELQPAQNNEDLESNNSETNMTNNTTAKIDVARDRFPHCIVWTPIPMISWVLPFIGHMVSVE